MKFYSKIFTINALIMFIVILVFLLFKTQNLYFVFSQSFFSGIFFGLIMTMLSVIHVYIVDKAEKEIGDKDGEENIYSPKRRKKFDLSGEPNKLFDICLDFLEKMRFMIKKSDKEMYFIAAHCPFSLASWGHIINIKIQKKNAASLLEIEVKPKVPFTLFDFGKSSTILCDFTKYVKKRILL